MISHPGRTEHGEQVALFQIANSHIHLWPELKWLYAIPNGGQRHIAVARKMKAEGVKAGVSDVHFPVARGGYFSWYCEMKVGKNRPTKNQKEFIEFVVAQGNFHIIAYSADEAWGSLKEYLAQYPTTFPALTDELA